MTAAAKANIMFRTGDFCVHPYCFPRNAARIRLSFYLYNTLEECRTFVDLCGPYCQRVAEWCGQPFSPHPTLSSRARVETLGHHG